jgi:long-subunit fatty acid transport protein
MVKKFLFIALLFTTSICSAQIHEVGVFVGGSNYIGDIGPTNYILPNNFAGGIIYKYNLNPRIALRGTFTYAQITSDDADSDNDARKLRDLNFTNDIKEFAVGVEFSYFEYGSESKSLQHTPYLLLEFAAFNYKTAITETSPNQYNYANKTSYSIPFGIGYKTKIGESFALGLEIGARYTFEDDLDFNNTEIPSLLFGNPNSNDWYVFSGINLVYTFGRPACYNTPN